MKKFMLALLSFIIFSYTPCFATSEQELFDNGVKFFNQGQYSEAIEQFSELIKISPNNADAYNNRGVAYIRLKKFDLAIRDFEIVKKLMPDLKGLYSNIGTVMYYKEDYEKALLNYDMEIQREPDNYLAYFNKALCLSQLGKDEEALKSTDKAINLKPDFYWAHCFKGDILARKGNIEKAVESYEDAVYLNAETPYAKDMLAKLIPRKIEKPSPQLTSTVIAKHNPQPVTKKTEQQIAIPEDQAKIITNPAAIDKKFSVQTGAYLKKKYAEERLAEITAGGFSGYMLILKDSKNKIWHLVRYGQYNNPSEAKNVAAEIKEKLGIDAVVRPAGTW